MLAKPEDIAEHFVPLAMPALTETGQIVEI
jgi:hypothetical protein